MTYDIWFFVKVIIGILFIVGFIYFIDWFISRIGLDKHERDFSNAIKKANKGKLTFEEFIEARNKYYKLSEHLRINRIRKDKLNKLKNL